MLLRSEEHTSELQSRENLVCRLLLEKKKTNVPINAGREQNTSTWSPLDAVCQRRFHRAEWGKGYLGCVCFFFFFNDTATMEIYTLSLHDALPISPASSTAWTGSLAACTARSICSLHACSRSEEHTSELQSRENLVCRLLLEK